MPEVVGKAQSFGQVFVQAERSGDRPADLSDLDAVREPDPKMIAVRSNEYLCLVPKPAERDRVHDAVAVALEDVARAARGEVGLGMKAATRPVGSGGQP